MMGHGGSHVREFFLGGKRHLQIMFHYHFLNHSLKACEFIQGSRYGPRFVLASGWDSDIIVCYWCDIPHIIHHFETMV